MTNSHDYDALMRANVLRVFNERHDAARLGAIGDIYSIDAVLYEPNQEARGHVAINEAVKALQASLPADFAFSVQADAAGHHDLGTLVWRLHSADGDIDLPGMDVARFAEGKIVSLHVFPG